MNWAEAPRQSLCQGPGKLLQPGCCLLSFTAMAEPAELRSVPSGFQVTVGFIQPTLGSGLESCGSGPA